MTADPYKWRSRLGRFQVNRRLREDWPDGVMLIQSKVLVRECLVDWTTDAQNYVGEGPMFDVVAEGEAVPHYTLVVHQKLTAAGVEPVDVTWERCTNGRQIVWRLEAPMVVLP